MRRVYLVFGLWYSQQLLLSVPSCCSAAWAKATQLVQSGENPQILLSSERLCLVLLAMIADRKFFIQNARNGLCPHPGLADSHSRGLFAGLSLEGGVIVSRPDVNRKFYGRQVSVR